MSPQVCRVCSHEKRVEIERLLVEGRMSKLSIARRYSISKDSVRNHWNNHLSDRIARSEEIQAVEGTDILGTLNTVLYKLNNALNQADKIKDTKEFRETSKVLFQGVDLLTKIQISLQNKKIRSLDEDELEEFSHWQEHRWDGLAEMSEHDLFLLERVCVEKISKMSGASDRANFVKTSSIYQDHAPRDKVRFEAIQQLNREFPLVGESQFEKDQPHVEPPPWEVDKIISQEPTEEVREVEQDQEDETMRPKKIEPEQIPHTDLSREELRKMRRQIDFGPKR